MNQAEMELLKTAFAASFTLQPPKITTLVDPEEVAVLIAGAFEDGEDEAEWAAVPFLFAIACLSFADARSRGYSVNDFDAEDELSLGDFLPRLHFSKGGLEWRGDYIKGRRVKSTLRVAPNGTFEVETWERGEAATRWLDRLRGKRPLQVVSASEPDSAGGAERGPSPDHDHR